MQLWLNVMFGSIQELSLTFYWLWQLTNESFHLIDTACIVTTLRLPGADLVEELLPVLALGPLVRAGDIHHVGGCDYKDV